MSSVLQTPPQTHWPQKNRETLGSEAWLHMSTVSQYKGIRINCRSSYISKQQQFSLKSLSNSLPWNSSLLHQHQHQSPKGRILLSLQEMVPETGTDLSLQGSSGQGRGWPSSRWSMGHHNGWASCTALRVHSVLLPSHSEKCWPNSHIQIPETFLGSAHLTWLLNMYLLPTIAPNCGLDFPAPHKRSLVEDT